MNAARLVASIADVKRGSLNAWAFCLATWLALSVVLGGPADTAAHERIAELERQLAASPTNGVVLVQLAKLHHNEATRGAKDAAFHTAKARTYLDRLLAQEPKHAFGLALLGSTTVLTAREVFWPGTKIKRVREGLVLLDAALANAPDDHNARFTRAVNNLFLPDLFERRVVVEGDFRWLRERADRGEFDSEFRQYVFLYHGRALAKWAAPDGAKEAWQRGLDIDPKSKVADELRRELEAAMPKPPAA